MSTFFGQNIRDAQKILHDPEKPLTAIAAMAVDLGDSRLSAEFPLVRQCPHGLAFRNIQLPAGAWNGPVSECACCYGTFGYIDTAAFSANRTETRTWTPKNRCATCGGKYVDCDSRVSATPEGAQS